MGTAHLAPYQFKPGQRANPKGRPRGGAAMVEWRHAMAGWSKDRLLKVVEPKSKAPPPKQAAAAEWLTAMEHGRLDAHGRLDPEPGKARQRIEERDMGKPMQQLDVTTPGLPRPPDQVRAELVPALVQLLKSDPGMRAALAEALRSCEPVALPIIDGQAVVIETGVAPPQATPRPAGGLAPTSSLACEGPAGAVSTLSGAASGPRAEGPVA